MSTYHTAHCFWHIAIMDLDGRIAALLREVDSDSQDLWKELSNSAALPLASAAGEEEEEREGPYGTYFYESVPPEVEK